MRAREAMTSDPCLHELFEAQAERTPAAVALVGGEAEMSYADLERSANRLAHHLRRRGAGPEVRIGVCAARSPELVVALLGILKAGAAYVPLDPTYPAEHLAFTVRDAGIELVLAGAAAPLGFVPTAAEVVALDPAGGGVRDEPEARPEARVRPDGLAYVIYTSGSTGRPKGVMVPHRAIANHTRWLQDTFRLRPDDRLLHKTPVGFDPSITEFFAPLVAGGRLVLARSDGHQDPPYLVDMLIRHRITVLQVVPTLLRLLLEQPRLASCASLRMLFSGGEALPVELVERLRERLAVAVHNLYGPTEAAVDAMCQPDVRASRRAVVEIGRPIANCSVHLLDAELRPVAPGEPGELYLGGLPLARGYLDRPDLTAGRFVPDPFAPAAAGGARLYRTGDLARAGEDGSVEFLGRSDQQLKLGGVRIEPGEIEAVMREHPAVREAAVVARQDAPGGRRLVGYAAAGPDAGGDRLAGQLRDHLRARLPGHMVPASIVVLEELPRTASGKLDRRGLPAPGARPAESPAGYAAPRTPLERELADAFARLLGVERLGVDDALVDLGADSLLVAQLGTHVVHTYGVDLALFVLFSVPTVAGVAEVVEAYARHGGDHLETMSASLFEAEAVLDPSVVPEW